jgi:hypothetical protein
LQTSHFHLKHAKYPTFCLLLLVDSNIPRFGLAG